MTNAERYIRGDKGASNGKRQHIAAIAEGVPRENISSKGTMKRKIAELMAIYNKNRNTSAKTLNRPLLGLWNRDKVRGNLE